MRLVDVFSGRPAKVGGVVRRHHGGARVPYYTVPGRKGVFFDLDEVAQLRREERAPEVLMVGPEASTEPRPELPEG